MTPISNPAILTELLTAINSDGYGSETIDRIISVASVPAPGYTGEDTIVIAQSGIKQLVFLMNDTRPQGETFQSRILNPDDLGDAANFAEYEMKDADELATIAENVRSIDFAPAARLLTLGYLEGNADELATIAENVLGSITEYVRSPDFSNELASAIKRTSRLLTSGDFAESPLDDRDDLDILADRVRESNPIAPWIEQLRDAMLTSTDLSSFAEGLTDRFADLDATDFRESMTQAMTIASMAGYLEAGNDAQ